MILTTRRLGVLPSDHDEIRVKAELANRFAALVDQLGLLQSEVARRTGLAQSDVSRIVNGSIKNYSVWRLMTALTALGQTVTIAVTPAGEEQGAGPAVV